MFGSDASVVVVPPEIVSEAVSDVLGASPGEPLAPVSPRNSACQLTVPGTLGAVALNIASSVPELSTNVAVPMTFPPLENCTKPLGGELWLPDTKASMLYVWLTPTDPGLRAIDVVVGVAGESQLTTTSPLVPGFGPNVNPVANGEE